MKNVYFLDNSRTLSNNEVEDDQDDNNSINVSNNSSNKIAITNNTLCE